MQKMNGLKIYEDAMISELKKLEFIPSEFVLRDSGSLREFVSKLALRSLIALREELFFDTQFEQDICVNLEAFKYNNRERVEDEEESDPLPIVDLTKSAINIDNDELPQEEPVISNKRQRDE